MKTKTSPLSTYKIVLRGYNADGTFSLITAKTRGKAKYLHFISLCDVFQDFGTYLRFIQSCTKISGKNIDAAYKDQDDFRKVAIYRKVPEAYIGMTVEVSGKRGYIIGANDSCNFDIAFDDGVFNCHPYGDIVYFGKNGEIVYDFRYKEPAGPNEPPF